MRMANPRRLHRKHDSLPPALAGGARGRLLQTALRLFASKGFHGTSIRDLATALEMQPSAVYAHFPSKDHLLAELVRGGNAFHHDELRAALLEAGSSPKEQIRGIVRANARLHATYPLLAIIVNEEARFLPEELFGAATVLREQSIALIRQVLERGIARKEFAPPHLMTALAAIAALGSRIPYWYGSDTGLDVEALADAQAELALRMLGAR
jgi:AcrR family transcriptional regulator